ncbi:MAG: DEAD/DEAH box helicase [Thermoplasmatales archaeon]|jgi:CRISPR-associated endonuclease/helicase Cas3|nr:DEAD/DEAH box helicase [Thermoplasmatales archaeon]
MSESIEFNFDHEYVDTDETGTPSFQREFVDEIINGNHEVLFLHAPTGAGKTYSFILAIMNSNPKRMDPHLHIIVAEPTNEIVNEFYCKFVTMMEKNPSNGTERPTARMITGQARSSEGRMKEIRGAVSNNNLVVTNPDTLSLYVAGNYLRTARKDSANFQDALMQADVVIFDEYHSYDPQSLGKILSILLVSRSLNLGTPKFVFSTATPSEKFMRMVKEAVGDVNVLEISASADPFSMKGREIRGELKVIVTDEDIFDTVGEAKKFSEGRGLGRLAYIFNSVVEAERFVGNLEADGIHPEVIDGYRRHLRSKTKEEINCAQNVEAIESAVIIATSSIELGVNIPDLSMGRIRAGYYFENFAQRLGRFARSGQHSVVYVHVDHDLIEGFRSIKNGGYNDYSDFLLQVSKLIASKHMSETEVLNNRDVFTYCIWRNTNRPGLKDSIKDALKSCDGGYLFGVDQVLEEIREGDPSSEHVKSFVDWWKDYFLSFGYFRGAVSEVTVRLPNGLETKYDWLHVLRWAQLRVDSGVYVIERWREKGEATKPSVSFRDFRHGEKVLDWEKVKPGNERLFREEWKEQLKSDLRTYLHIRDDEKLKRYAITLGRALNVITPRTLRPIDIKVQDNDNIFI